MQPDVQCGLADDPVTIVTPVMGLPDMLWSVKKSVT